MPIYPMQTSLSSDQKGMSLLEGALVLPLLSLLLFGIIQWGMIFAVMISAKNASAVGARLLLLNPAPDDTQVRQEVRNALAPFDPGGTATISPNRTYSFGAYAGARRLDIEYDLQLFVPFVVMGANPDGTFTIRSSTIVR